MKIILIFALLNTALVAEKTVLEKMEEKALLAIKSGDSEKISDAIEEINSFLYVTEREVIDVWFCEEEEYRSKSKPLILRETRKKEIEKSLGYRKPKSQIYEKLLRFLLRRGKYSESLANVLEIAYRDGRFDPKNDYFGELRKITIRHREGRGW